MPHQNTGRNRVCTWNRPEKNTVTEISGTTGSVSGETKGIYEKTVYAWGQKQLFQNRSRCHLHENERGRDAERTVKACV